MRFIKTILVILTAGTTTVFGGVNIKNLNFFKSNTDISVPGAGGPLELTFTCNSTSPEIGWTGYGCGSYPETSLQASPDGSVVIREHGAGAKTRFTPKSAVDHKAAASKIIDAIKKRTGSSYSEKYLATLRNNLEKSDALRLEYARSYRIKNKIPSGTVLYSNERGMQKLHRMKKGYKRVFSDGKKEFFNDKGQLYKVVKKNKYAIDIEYGKNGLPKKMTDTYAKQLFFEWYPSGRLKKVYSSSKKFAAYEYNDNNLVKRTDAEKNVYKYEWDGNHNMTATIYSDGSKQTVKYDPKTQFTKEVKDRNGMVTRYESGNDPKNPDLHYWTKVKRKAKGSKVWVEDYFEYEIKKRPDGSNYTYRIVTKKNKLKTETIYSECCSLPIKITKGKKVTTFEYSKNGLLTKKASNTGDLVKIEYHKKFNKISKVVNNDGWTQFQYNKKGNLSKAVNDQGQSVLLVYDRKGRITTMIDYKKKTKQKRKLTFEYNSQDRPIKITMANRGSIDVSYDNAGEIQRVKSKSGPEMALQVTQSFQSLLSIVRPAGVSLNI